MQVDPLVSYTEVQRLNACDAVDIKPKTRGFQVKQASAELVDTPKKEDVALFLHTSGTTSRPKVVVSFPEPLRHSSTVNSCKVFLQATPSYVTNHSVKCML